MSVAAPASSSFTAEACVIPAWSGPSSSAGARRETIGRMDDRRGGVSPRLLAGLEAVPDALAAALTSVPSDRLRWRPADWGGSPGESFSAIEHVCHVRDIERDGYHVRIRRLLDE